MSKQLTQEIKKANPRDTPSVNKELLQVVGALLESSGNEEIAAQGVLVSAAAVAIDGKIMANTNAHDAAKSTTKAVNKSNSDGVDVFNAAAVVVQQQLPGNIDAQEALGFTMTSATAQDASIPAKVVNGSMSQGDFDATCDIHYDKVVDAHDYSVKITNGDPSDRSKYVQVSLPSLTFTTSNITIPIPAGYLNVPIWFIVTANNTAGSGPPSEPFGGRNIQ